MHSLFYLTFLTFVLTYLLSQTTQVNSTFYQEDLPQQKFYQDLTGPIDKILNEANMDSLLTLREALKESTYVFYSSGKYFKNIFTLYLKNMV